MKIGGKKIRPMANPVPLPKALASLTLYIMLIMASMILISTMIMEIIKLSFVSRVQEPMSARNMQAAMRFYKKYNRHILE